MRQDGASLEYCVRDSVKYTGRVLSMRLRSKKIYTPQVKTLQVEEKVIETVVEAPARGEFYKPTYECDICGKVCENSWDIIADCEYDYDYCKRCYKLVLRCAKERMSMEADSRVE